ncbi:MAG: YaiI/YqxD family protein [Myxococcales bacterium]|nr:YaiI/YqxD family protein [Myxococcales bacterium]MCB9550464.1 YaiI/YqxD family protein [Myxococcales bacterium]
MTIWVDADAVPRPCRELLYRAAERRAVAVVLVANTPQSVPGGRITAVQVAGGPDVADDYIAARCGPDDLVITADIPLAARAVDRGAAVITPRGRPLDAESVGEALSLRDFHDELRTAGTMTGGPPPYDAKAKQQFANALDRWITARR